MDEVKTDQSTVTIEMAAQEIEAANKPDEPQAPAPSPTNPQSEQPQTEELSTEDKQEELKDITAEVELDDMKRELIRQGALDDRNNPVKDIDKKCDLCGKLYGKCDEDCDNYEALITPLKTDEAEKKKNREIGRPCGFCEDRTRIMQKVNLYREYCEGKIDGKPHIPYLQELCGYDYLDMLTTTLWDWVNSEKHIEEHTELSNTIKKILERQQLRLLQRTLGVHNPSGAIFQLKANHGMIETEKQILAGQSGEPLEYNIHIVPKKQQKELEGE